MFLLSPWPWLDGAISGDAAWFDGAPIADVAWLDDDDSIPLIFLPPRSDDVLDYDVLDDDAPTHLVRNGAAGGKRPRRRHPGVDFTVDDPNRTEHVFHTFDEAASFAVGLARSNGSRVHLNVIVYSPAGARWWGGDDAVAAWNDDPDASVFERIEVRADSLGRVP